MIGYLKGKCQSHVGPGEYIILAGEIGFSVKTAIDFEVDKDVELFIYEHIREDIFDLYGFQSKEDLVVFKQMVSISGVGPKVGLLILKQGPIDDLQKAVEENNVPYFEMIPGIGKKMAQKLVLELRSKIGADSDISALTSDSHGEIKEALISLGYKTAEFNKLLQKIPKDLKSDQEKITWALKQLGKKK